MNCIMIHVIINGLKNNVTPNEPQGLWQLNLLKALGQTGLGALLAQQLGLPSRKWIVVSPVHSQATHNDAMIIATCQEFEWQSAMEDYYLNFVKWMAQDGIAVHRFSNSIWLMDATNFPDLNTLSVGEMHHRSLQPYLMEFPSPWLKWWTEVQMMLHGVRGQGPYAINAVWPWGAGNLPVFDSLWTLSKSDLYREISKIYPQVEVWHSHVKLQERAYFLIEDAEQTLLLKHPLNQFDSHWWWLDADEKKPAKNMWNSLKGWWNREN